MGLVISDGLVDFGAQMAVVHSSLVRDLDLTFIGRVKLRGIVGPFVQAVVIRLRLYREKNVALIIGSVMY